MAQAALQTNSTVKLHFCENRELQERKTVFATRVNVWSHIDAGTGINVTNSPCVRKQNCGYWRGREGGFVYCMSVKNKVWILTLSNLILEAGGTTFAVSLSGQFGTTDRTDSTRTSEYTNWYGIKHFIPAYSLYKRLTRWKKEWFKKCMHRCCGATVSLSFHLSV